MEINEKKGFNIEEAYKEFVERTVSNTKEMARQIKPDDMYEELHKRKDLISLMEEICSEFKDNTHWLFGIFNDWIKDCKINEEIKNKNINFIFNLLENLTILVSSENVINAWRTQLSDEIKIFDKIELYNLTPDEIIKDKKLLKKINKKIKN